MNVCIGWVGAALQMEEGIPDQLCLPRPNVRYLFTVQMGPAGTGHYDLELTCKAIQVSVF